MDLNKDYYKILSVSGDANEKTIKKRYYKLSFEHHPDKGGNPIIFAEMTEAYDVLCSELRKEYDLKSKFGKNYNEYYELFDINIEYDHKKSESHLKKFKDDEVLNIKIVVDEDFDGNLEYQRWVKCKTCSGTGKDLSSKIVIRDTEGNVVKTFDSDDGCDFCEGSGKDWSGNSCHFCQGAGKVGLTLCQSCNGEKRILGKQKLTNIKLESSELKLDAMGHHSKREVGKSGYLLVVKTIQK